MPIAHIQSSEDKKTQKASYKRRRNQNSEITQLEALLPWSQKGSGIDKISVLRLTSAYLRFKNFWQSAYGDVITDSQGQAGFSRLFSEAIDGFIMILSANGEVVFVSEGIADSVGISQQDVMGVSIYELTHEDDAAAIQDSLKPNGPHLQQSRQFYIRFKSSITPGKKQLSKFGGTVMLQVSGKLKLSHDKSQNDLVVTGLVAECRRIEASSSILELKVPQTVFTSTTTMDLKILSLDTKMRTVTGFNSDVEGSVLTDFFHPSDNRRSIHCLKTLLITGQASSPIIRFMTHTGEWVWVQIQGLVRYEMDNRTPKYLEATFKVICSNNGSIKMIEQTELYGKSDESGESNSGIHADSRFNIPAKPQITSPDAIVRSVEKTSVSAAVRDVLLHGRETALASIPTSLDRLATWPEVVDAVVEYETSKGLPPNYSSPYPQPDKVASTIAISEGGTSVESPHSSYSPSSSSGVSSSLSDLTPSGSPSSYNVTPSPLNDDLIKNSPASIQSLPDSLPDQTNPFTNDDPLLSLLAEVDSPQGSYNQPSPAASSYVSNNVTSPLSYVSNNDTSHLSHSYYNSPSPVTANDYLQYQPQNTYMMPSPPSSVPPPSLSHLPPPSLTHLPPLSHPTPSLQGIYYAPNISGPPLLTTPQYPPLPIQLPVNGSIFTTPTNGPHMYVTPPHLMQANGAPPTFPDGIHVSNPYSIEGKFEVSTVPSSSFPPYVAMSNNHHITNGMQQTQQQQVLDVSTNF